MGDTLEERECRSRKFKNLVKTIRYFSYAIALTMFHVNTRMTFSLKKYQLSIQIFSGTGV